MAASHGALSFMGLSPSPSAGWSGSGGLLVWVMGAVYCFGYGMKSVQASVGCLVHGPRSMVLETQDRGSCFMVYGPRSQGQGPTALVPAQQAKIPRPRAVAITPRPWILGTGCKIPGTRLGAQQPTSKQPGPRSTDLGPGSTPIGLGPNCQGRGIELEPQSPGFRRPRDQDAAQRTSASTGVLRADGKVRGSRSEVQEPS